MAEMPSKNRTQITCLILIPSVITLVITVLRVIGELLHWSPALGICTVETLQESNLTSAQFKEIDPALELTALNTVFNSPTYWSEKIPPDSALKRRKQ